jgi:hypothetical protein
MRDIRLLIKAKLKGGQVQNRAQEDSIRDIASSADSVGPKTSRSPIVTPHISKPYDYVNHMFKRL